MPFEKKELKKKSENISDWYNDVVLKAELADYGPVRGTMVIRPYGYAIWEKVQEIFNGMIKKANVQNAYFPMFIPMSLLEKEKEHIEGFSPELAVVTIGGGEKLSEPLAVRPTSETIMYAMFSKWIHSYRDLPLLLNQWCNIVRWEKRTYLFLRTTEFLWQEGHTAHATHKESINWVERARAWYQTLYEDYFAMPVMTGIKSANEKFAGAVSTYCVEPLMPDGKVLQAATSHDLGQNFSKVFDIKFQNADGKQDFVWQTSWGVSTRSLGGLFLAHGDDNGLILPPKIAPIQVVIVPIHKYSGDLSKINHYIQTIDKELGKKNIRCHYDERYTISPGRRFNDWEVKGVPIRLEIGTKEVDDNVITYALRDTGEKQTVSKEQFLDKVDSLLENFQKRLFDKQKKFLDDNTHSISSWDEFVQIMKTTRGFLRMFWCEDPVCEKEIKEKTKATSRCLPLEEKEEEGVCVHCGKPSHHRWIFGQSY